MKTRFLIIIPVIVGIVLSLSFIINIISGGAHFTQDIDPRFSEAT